MIPRWKLGLKIIGILFYIIIGCVIVYLSVLTMGEKV